MIERSVPDPESAMEFLQAAVAGLDDHFAIFDRDWQYVYVNQRAAEVLGKSVEELTGNCIWEIFPDAVGNQFFQELHQAAAEGRAIHSDHYYPPFDRWFENHIYPFAGGVCVISSEITARKRAEAAREEERRRAVEALREADRRKDEFLAMLAHELRNPLAPIRNAARALRHLEPSDPRREQSQDIIERQLDHLSRLVDDLLDISRITQGKVTLRRETLDLSTAVSRAVETARPLMDSRRQRLRVSLPPEPLFLEADLVRLSQVIGNLLNNAAKYTPEGGNIEIAAEERDGQAVVRVRDDGIGIQPEQLTEVFELFTQADSSLARTEGGLGIGLTLVRSLVELHGGTVEARSEGAGQGSEFIVRLPTGSPPAGSAAPRGGLPARDSAARRILVVDDNRDAAESLALLLEMSGHEVRAVFDGPAALEVAAAFHPEAVLLDLGLPQLDGYEVARRLRAMDGNGLLLIAVTGYGQEEDVRRSREAGFDHHLVKPLDFDRLRELLG